MTTVAFSLLPGIFRGGRDLSAVLRSRCSPSARTPTTASKKCRSSRSRSRRPTLSSPRRRRSSAGAASPRRRPSQPSGLDAPHRRQHPHHPPRPSPRRRHPRRRRRRRRRRRDVGCSWRRLRSTRRRGGGGGGAAAALTFPEPPTSPPAHLAATSARAGSGAPAAADGPTGALPTAAEAEPRSGAGWGEGRACCGARGGLRAGARRDISLYNAPCRGGGLRRGGLWRRRGVSEGARDACVCTSRLLRPRGLHTPHYFEAHNAPTSGALHTLQALHTSRIKSHFSVMWGRFVLSDRGRRKSGAVHTLRVAGCWTQHRVGAQP